MRTIFQIPSAKYVNLAFLVLNLRIFIFLHETLQADSRELIPNMAMVFQGCCPKHPNNAFLVRDLEILIFAWNKLEGVDYKYDSFSTFHPKTQREFFWSQVYFFSFWMKVYSYTISRMLIKSLIMAFIKLQAQNT